ncbi:MAG: MmcQ/YjbR family DNA-binding protein [Candidatus Delongbacteria bacterium]|nr:MmcQ/YjbR family DNA-binding protein [Candidatus Cloacimonadota bacterium]MCB9474519.1 MmcQ/YjbR family DNA-binding protein [Candidatus Delongbacteria bacterium]
MDGKALRTFCLNLPGTSEDLPFGEDVLAFRVLGKIYALLFLGGSTLRVNLKCDPHWAIQLRAEHTGITPGYHMNKRLWNTVIQDGSVDDRLLERLIEHSRECVLAGCSKSQRDGLLGKSV